MKTKQLINEYLSKRKGTLIVYLILCILYYPLQRQLSLYQWYLINYLYSKIKKFIYQILLIIKHILNEIWVCRGKKKSRKYYYS